MRRERLGRRIDRGPDKPIHLSNGNSQGTLIQGNTIGLAADGVTPIVTRSGITVSPMTGNYHAFGTLIASNHIASDESSGFQRAMAAPPRFQTGITGLTELGTENVELA